MDYNPHPEDVLTDAELAVLRCAARGLCRSETGTLVGYSSRGVAKLRASAVAKLHARNLTHAIFLAACYRVLTCDDCFDAREDK